MALCGSGLDGKGLVPHQQTTDLAGIYIFMNDMNSQEVIYSLNQKIQHLLITKELLMNMNMDVSGYDDAIAACQQEINELS